MCGVHTPVVYNVVLGEKREGEKVSVWCTESCSV